MVNFNFKKLTLKGERTCKFSNENPSAAKPNEEKYSIHSLFRALDFLEISRHDKRQEGKKEEGISIY
jgi:hypothetical protein